MTTFLVDYENTSYHGLEGFKALAPNDAVVIFLGAKNASLSMPIDVVRALSTMGARPRLLWKRSKKTSKNYLDLQLVSYLGSLIGDPEIHETAYVIVSNDRDFEAAIDFWAERRKEVTIELRPTISHPSVERVPEEQPLPAKAVSEATKRAVRSAVKELALKPSDYSAIYRSLLAADSSQGLHDSLSQALGAQGQKVYPLVKDLYLQQ